MSDITALCPTCGGLPTEEFRAAFNPAQAIAQVDGAGSESEACQRALDSLVSIKKEIG